MGDKLKGLIGKFTVTRNDGKSAAGEKHDGCSYFSLDLTHDPHAKPALAAYAKSARKVGYTALADDLDGIVKSLGVESQYFCTDNLGASVASLKIAQNPDTPPLAPVGTPPEVIEAALQVVETTADLIQGYKDVCRTDMLHPNDFGDDPARLKAAVATLRAALSASTTDAPVGTPPVVTEATERDVKRWLIDIIEMASKVDGWAAVDTKSCVYFILHRAERIAAALSAGTPPTVTRDMVERGMRRLRELPMNAMHPNSTDSHKIVGEVLRAALSASPTEAK